MRVPPPAACSFLNDTLLEKVKHLYMDALNNPEKYRDWLKFYLNHKLSVAYRGGLVISDGWVSNLKGKVIKFKTTTVETLYVIFNAFDNISLRVTRIVQTKTRGQRCEFLVKIIDEECAYFVKSLLKDYSSVLTRLSNEELIELLAGIFDGDGIVTKKYIAISVKPEATRKGFIVYNILVNIFDRFGIRYHKSYERVYLSIKDLREKLPDFAMKVHHPRRKELLTYHLLKLDTPNRGTSKGKVFKEY